MIKCLIDGNALAVVEAASDLMPSGVPLFSAIPSFPAIVQLVAQIEQRSPGKGRKTLRKAILLLVKNYCASQNIPANKKPSVDQEVEIASYLLDECGNYRLEDYVLMFTMAKRNKLAHGSGENKGRVFDRIDIQLIAELKEQYEVLRVEGAYQAQEQENQRREKLLLPDPRDRPEQPEEEKRANFQRGMQMFKEILLEQRRNKVSQSQKEREETKQKQEQLWERLRKQADEEGHTGPLIDLSQFKKQIKKKR